MTRRFTRRELQAIEEALSARTAGEMDIEDDPDAPRREDYDTAWEKVSERLNKMGRT